MGNNIPSYLLQTSIDQYKSANAKRAKLSFIDKTILNSATAVKSIYLQAESSVKVNFIQKVNPYVKLILLIYIILMISIVSNPGKQILVTVFIFLLYIIAKLKIVQVYRKVFLLSFVFGFLIVLPASLNVITPGKIIFNLVTFNKPSHLWIYDIPQNIGCTSEGFQVVALIFLRVFNSVSFAMLIVFTTSFPAFIKSFKILGVPDTFLMIIALAYKYIFILSRTIEETYFALKSRLSGNIKTNKIRKLISGRIFFIFRRSMIIYENTYYAMVSRGYGGEVRLYSQKHFAIKDFIVLGIIVALGIVIILI